MVAPPRRRFPSFCVVCSNFGVFGLRWEDEDSFSVEWGWGKVCEAAVAWNRLQGDNYASRECKENFRMNLVNSPELEKLTHAQVEESIRNNIITGEYQNVLRNLMERSRNDECEELTQILALIEVMPHILQEIQSHKDETSGDLQKKNGRKRKEWTKSGEDSEQSRQETPGIESNRGNSEKQPKKNVQKRKNSTIFDNGLLSSKKQKTVALEEPPLPPFKESFEQKRSLKLPPPDPVKSKDADWQSSHSLFRHFGETTSPAYRRCHHQSSSPQMSFTDLMTEQSNSPDGEWMRGKPSMVRHSNHSTRRNGESGKENNPNSFRCQASKAQKLSPPTPDSTTHNLEFDDTFGTQTDLPPFLHNTIQTNTTTFNAPHSGDGSLYVPGSGDLVGSPNTFRSNDYFVSLCIPGSGNHVGSPNVPHSNDYFGSPDISGIGDHVGSPDISGIGDHVGSPNVPHSNDYFGSPDISGIGDHIGSPNVPHSNDYFGSPFIPGIGDHVGSPNVPHSNDYFGSLYIRQISPDSGHLGGSPNVPHSHDHGGSLYVPHNSDDHDRSIYVPNSGDQGRSLFVPNSGDQGRSIYVPNSGDYGGSPNVPQSGYVPQTSHEIQNPNMSISQEYTLNLIPNQHMVDNQFDSDTVADFFRVLSDQL